MGFAEVMTTTAVIVIFVVGFLFGCFIRGVAAKSRIGQLKNELREQEIRVQIETVRMKESELLERRIN